MAEAGEFLPTRISTVFFGTLADRETRGRRIGRQIDLLAGLVAMLHEHGIKVVPFVAPIQDAKLCSLQGFEEFLSMIEEAIGQPLLDYSGSLTETADFSDPFHVNQAGATRLAHLVANDVTKGTETRSLATVLAAC
jgi:hypothetical protein